MISYMHRKMWPLIVASRAQPFNPSFQRHGWITLRAACCWLALPLAIVLLTGCTRAISTAPVVTPTASVRHVSILRVRISPENGIFVSGTSNLPDGECVKTGLLSDGKAESWWPGDQCVQVASGKWEMLVPLGRRGAPATMDPESQYEMRALWAGDPDKVTDSVHFNLSGLEQSE